jgi:hypothetical protein
MIKIGNLALHNIRSFAMANIGVVSNPAVNIPHLNVPQVKSGGSDADGDNDGSKAGQASNPPPVQTLATSGTVGTKVNTVA